MFQLAVTYNDHLVQLPSHFRARFKCALLEIQQDIVIALVPRSPMEHVSTSTKKI